MSVERVQSQIGGREFIIETGKMAKQAHGAVTIQCGDTVVLAAVVGAFEPKKGQDFLKWLASPLMLCVKTATWTSDDPVSRLLTR